MLASARGAPPTLGDHAHQTMRSRAERSVRVCAVLMRTAQVIDGVTVKQLVALADGTLPHEAWAAVEARVADSPEATEQLRAQRRALAATQAFDPPVPAGFEPRLRAAARRPAARPFRPVLVGVAAVAVLALAIALSAVTDRGVTVEAVAAISARSALDAAPAAGRPETLARSFAGVRFPDWSSAHGWSAVGARRDHVDGRATDTVYYRHTHHRIGYTVLSGPSLGLPWEGRRVVSNGVDIQLYRDGERTVAVFERAGRTCVLAGVVHREDTLVKLASWRGDGALTF
jgi:hypothetical protein